ncbi:RING finger protein 10-like [Gigantopelta aegis]|uniref:RING finger protein 10-like n=1 Tax=Gigantopelta aegis TaxID=1735272 RepID=UPI001B887D06|nr:RING finger protein 10-like [Gigantopelta aegis]
MLEEGAVTMDKKPSRQSSVPPKNGASSDNKKNDTNSPSRFAKYGRRETSGRGRDTHDGSRRPVPQRSRAFGDKRPRPRGYFNDRQREEVVDAPCPELGSALYSGSKKANYNHLLNFTFAERESGQRGYSHGGGRKQHYSGRVRYNKECFLQANYQFVVHDLGDYVVHSIDADKLVDWDLVEQVRTASSETPSCPICLQIPQAAKITRCGHIYCWACILHYLALGEKTWRKCPICYEAVHIKDLKSVLTKTVHQYRPGEEITMKLMKREKGTTYSVPKSQWDKRDGKPHSVEDGDNTKYMKILIASVNEIQALIIEPEKKCLQHQLKEAETSEVCFIEGALTMLKEREEILYGCASSSNKTDKMLEQKPDKVAGKSPVTTSLPERISPVKPGFSCDGRRKIIEYASAFSDEEVFDDEREDSESLKASPSWSSVSDPEISELLEDIVIETDESTVAVPIPVATGSTPTPVMSADPAVSGNPMGSPENPFATSSMQQNLTEDDTMPTDEAAAYLELPTETPPKYGNKRQNVRKDAFYYYQASDGQHIYMHALNARCMVREYGSLEDCPNTVTATIVAMESIFMTEDLRKRLRYLNHLPLTCEFQVVELALKPPVVSKDTLRAFSDEIEKRHRMRQKKVRDEKIRSKRIDAEEKEKFGLFAGLSVPLDSTSQFPVTTIVPSDMYAPATTAPESPTSGNLSGLNENVDESSGSVSDDRQQSSMSFAQMLKAGKTRPCAWLKPVENTASVEKPTKVSGDVESDDEDGIPVPQFQDSFSSALSAALVSLDKPKDGESKPQSSKKKKKKQQLLFTTAMTRGK